MTDRNKRKGDDAEREVETILRDLLGVAGCRRALGAGRADDVGDIFGIQDTVIQVAAYTDIVRAIREKLPTVEQQRINARATFSAVFCRRAGRVGEGPRYVVVMTPEMFACLWREAVAS